VSDSDPYLDIMMDRLSELEREVQDLWRILNKVVPEDKMAQAKADVSTEDHQHLWGPR
jgi:hypothetical protein